MTYIPPSRRSICATCGSAIGITKTSAAEPRCRPCTRKHGGAGRYRKGCRCDLCRAGAAARMRAYAAQRRAAGRPIDYRARSAAVCAQCGAEFQARLDSGQRFCSRACLGLSQRGSSGKRARARMSPVRKRAEKVAALAAAGSTGGNRVWVQGACLVCDAQFLSPGLASRYCSPECRTDARSARSWISFAARRAIYVRDGWVCQICGETASRKYSSGDPWSPTLDHVVPRSLGGSDDPTNLRLSHLWCNSVRGDLSHYTDADLQGVG